MTDDSASQTQTPLWTTRDARAPDRYFSYSGASILIHWLTVVLVAALFLTAAATHQSLGIVFAVVLLGRVAWRVLRGFPRSADQPVVVNFIERLAILVMLVAILVATVTGLAQPLLSASPVTVFGVEWLAPVTNQPLSFAPTVLWLHGGSATLFLVALAVHLAFAVKHAVTRADGILLRIVKPHAGGH